MSEEISSVRDQKMAVCVVTGQGRLPREGRPEHEIFAGMLQDYRRTLPRSRKRAWAEEPAECSSPEAHEAQRI